MKLINSDDAVSESLGFVLIVLVIMTAISAVILIGYPMYQNSVNNAHMKNIEEGFYLLSANANKVALYETPTQSSELKLYGGTLSLGTDGYIKIIYKYDGDTGEVTEDTSIPLQVLEYSMNNKYIAYILGGVCRFNDGKSFLVKDPAAYKYTKNSQDTMVIPLIEYQNPDTAFAGTGLVRVEVRNPYYSRLSSTLTYPNSTNVQAKEIEVEISGKYNDCLKQYFMDNLKFQDITGSDSDHDDLGVIYLKKDPANTINLYIVHCQLYITVN